MTQGNEIIALTIIPNLFNSSMDSSMVVIIQEKYITALVEGMEKQTDGLLPCLIIHSSWPKQ